MSDRVHHFSVQIYYEDTDHSGVVYHPNFLKYFERAREHVIGSDRLASLWNDDDIGFAVYRADMKCVEGVRFADVCDVRSRCEADGQFRTIWHQELWRPGGEKAAVVARIEMVSIKRGGDLTPLPDHVREFVLREGSR
jgi:YbgC/YbaW family acyl-CoA thioester hydrolase